MFVGPIHLPFHPPYRDLPAPYITSLLEALQIEAIWPYYTYVAHWCIISALLPAVFQSDAVWWCIVPLQMEPFCVSVWHRNYWQNGSAWRLGKENGLMQPNHTYHNNREVSHPCCQSHPASCPIQTPFLPCYYLRYWLKGKTTLLPYSMSVPFTQQGEAE